MTDELRMSRSVADEMIAHVDAERPNEGCGLVAGRNSTISKVIRMTNAAASPVRYALEPKEQFAAYRMIEEESLELAGVFHSHTHTEAFPSPTDVRLASEDVPYIIVSLAHEPAQIRAFRIVKESWDATDGAIEEVPVVIEG